MNAVINIDHQELVEEITEKVIAALKPMLSSNADGDRLMVIEELCEYLQVEKGWVYQQVHSKSIPYLKAGGKLRFRKAEIDKYLVKAKK
jgi:excisionase family DNA binding protein